MSNQSNEVVLSTKNTPSLTLGIISIVIGVLSVLVGWFPFLGLLAIPFALIGFFFSGIGVLIALFKKFNGIVMPLLGGFICMIGFILPIVSTGGASAAITKATNEVSQDIEKARKEVAKKQEKQEQQEKQEKNLYIANRLQLYDVEAKYMSSVLNDHIPGVVFKIKNEGNRTLNKVEVTIYFMDSTGAVIAEENFLPILVSEYSMSNSKLLKPGYVWQMENDKFYSAKFIPSEWKEGSIEAKITDIQFSK
jgi:archaellum component FlaG (FlaF/FlaG flagellin family)